MSRPSDYLYLHPNVASQRPSAPTRAASGPSHPFHTASQRSSPSASKTSRPRPSALSAQHPLLLSHPSNYLLPFISFRVPMTVSSHTSPRRIPVAAHSRRMDDSPSSPFVILATLSICIPMSHSSVYHSDRPRHVTATACTKGVADGPYRPFNIASQYPSPPTSQRPIPAITGTHPSLCPIPTTAYTQKSGPRVVSYIQHWLLAIVSIRTLTSHCSDYHLRTPHHISATTCPKSG